MAPAVPDYNRTKPSQNQTFTNSFSIVLRAEFERKGRHVTCLTPGAT